MLILFLIVFIDLVGFGLIIPLLPFYAESFRATPFVVGLVMATYSLTQFVAAPAWGHLSDRVGRRPVLLASLAGAVIAYVWLAFADSLWTVFAARALGGAMAGNISAAFAYIADITTPRNRAKGMGLIGAAFGLGFIAGPAIGGMLAGPDPLNADYRTPALVAAGLSFVALALAIVRLRESLSREARLRMAGKPARQRWILFKQALRRPNVGLLIAISFLATFVFAGLETTFAMWSERRFNWGPEQNGYLFTFVGLLSVVIQGGLIGTLARRFGEARLIVHGALALAAGLALVPLSGSLPFLLAAMVILGCGFSVMTPSLNSLISLQVGEDDQGGVLGVSRSAATFARVVGAVWAGFLFHALGRDWPYYLGAVVMVGALVLAVRAQKAVARARTSTAPDATAAPGGGGAPPSGG